MNKKSTARERAQHRERQKRYRARVAWAQQFDKERLEKELIDPHEQKPFQDYETVEQMLHTARVFAFAFRQKGVQCPDIAADETIERFAYRVTRLWYSALLGKILHFVSLNTCEFNPDLGFTNHLPLESFDEDWQPMADSNVTVDITSLPPVAPAPAPLAAKMPKPPQHDCSSDRTACSDQSCLHFSWELYWERQREIERRHIEKSNELEWIAFQRKLLESETTLPSVSFRVSDDF